MIAGLDIGTTGSKIVVYETNGDLVDKFYRPYKTSRSNNINEIDGRDLVEAVRYLIKEVCSKYIIDSIGIDSFGEAFIMLDKDDNPLANIILMTDYRGQKEADILKQTIGEETIEKITGLSISPMYSLPKIMWFKNNDPILFSKVDKIFLIEDFIIYTLTGNRFIDYTLATRTLAFDIEKLEFSDEILNKVGIDLSLFSKPVQIGYNCGFFKEELAKEFGIPNKVTITTSGHDQIAVALGSAVFEKGYAVDGAGTVECIAPIFDRTADLVKLVERNYAIVPYLNKNNFITYAFSYTSGSLIDWFMSTFAKDLGKDAFKTLEKDFANGPTGLLVLPHFAGAATPYMDSESKGAIVGLTLESTLSNIYQAVLEGIAYEMRINIEYLKESNINIKRLVATGGGSLSRKWLQIKSDILNIPIDILNDNQSGSRGSAMSSGVAIGIFKDYREAANVMVKKIDEVVPNKENHNKYMRIYKKYKKLYLALKEVYEA